MRKLLQVEFAYLIIAASIAIWLLFTKVFIGVADNGDFLRIMGTAGLNYYDALESYEDRFFSYAHINFAYDTILRLFYPSTHIILVVVARFISLIFNETAFDIRYLGAIYVVLLLTAGFIFIKYNKGKSLITAIVIALLMLFIFSDIGYLAYFNSFYGEPVSFVFLLLTLALALMLTKQENPSRKMLVLLFISILFLVCSKTQNAPIGIVFSLLGLRYGWMKMDDLRWRRLAIILSIVTFLISIFMYIAAPKDFKYINIYQTVFFGILNGSPDVEGDLQQLGLPSKLSVLAGTNYFQDDTVIKQDDPSLTADFYNKISHGDVLLFYMMNPARLLGKMEYAAQNSMNIRAFYLGNYEKSEGNPAGAMYFEFSRWSELKRTYIPNTMWFITLFYILYYVVAAYEWLRSNHIRNRIAVELFIVLGLIGMFSFLIPIVGDGQADLSKHLFLFNVIFDMMIASAVIWIVTKVRSTKVDSS
ncbi:MAG: hypothetical protein NAG76_03910 [Candidatus Pristimantibacillus lignocellulolyticus]|uniref:Uncharacterized protein n=1 Tax=Candidatus Pristimantibacillus lignocellulolyticus TaxID=2994561 RepID=A0A9J6ZHB7_9BACL|nr:MAG: hypothetical protein NAG76_03910 [Candidatus Pristimantibacillus lignocellulolyticus]